MTEKNKSHPFMVIGGTKFTAREVEVLACVLQGRSAKKTASLLSLSPKTIENYHYNIRSKLECNSRENIRDFIELSDQALFLKKYYYFLIFRGEFKQRLKEFASQRLENFSCNIRYWENDENSSHVLSEIEKCLSLLRITPKTQVTNKPKSIKSILKEINKDASLEPSFYILPIDIKNDCDLNELNTLKKGNESLVILKQGSKKFFFTFPVCKVSDIESTINFYSSLLNIFQKLLADLPLKDLLEKLPIPPDISGHLSKENQIVLAFKKLKIGTIALGFVLTGSLGFYAFDSNTHFTFDADSIRSDLILPVSDTVLDRSKLTSQLNEKFKGKRGIYTIALIGSGGAGKTTVARLFTHHQKAKVVWEINAETPESLSSSFDNLAQALTKTEEDKKILADIQSIKNPSERENKIIQFVKEHLKLTLNWFLVFDNVESFRSIQKYFPHDPQTWGEGKLLITTRNSNIRNNKCVNDVVEVGELTDTEKLTFFIKVMKQGKNNTNLSEETAELNQLLKSIPSYPLDVSLAAYYIKSTHISLKTYLENLNSYHQEFVNVQEQLLKENGDYLKTRYGIVILSIQKLIDANTDFSDLFLFISLIDSQNIPRDMLNAQKDKFLIDSFIYNLKKYSLITNESSHSSSDSLLFLHRITQQITLDYLIKILNLEDKKNLMNKIFLNLEKYLESVIEAKNISQIKATLIHCQSLINKTDLLLGTNIREFLYSKMGCLYYYLGQHAIAKQHFENSLLEIKKTKNYNYSTIALNYVYLGSIYRFNGKYKKANDFFNKSLAIYKKYDSKNYEKIAWVLTCKAKLHWDLGNYAKAKDLLEEALDIFKHHPPKNKEDLAWALGCLGNTYREMGNYAKAKEFLEECAIVYKNCTPEDNASFFWASVNLGELYRKLGNYEKARNLSEQSLNFYKSHLSKDNIRTAWASSYLGSIYADLGAHEKAIDLVKHSLFIYKEHFSDNHVLIAWNLSKLGNAYGALCQLDKAMNLLQQSLTIYKEHYHENSTEIACLLRDLARIYFLKRNLEKAEELYLKSLEIFQTNNHPEKYTSLENLSDLFLAKENLIKNKGEIQLKMRSKAQDYLYQALESAQVVFPSDSGHIIRIKEKLKKISS